MNKAKEERSNLSHRPVAFLFPGLGNHYMNMGRELYEQESVFREAVDVCAAKLHNYLAMDLREVLFVAGTTDSPAAAGLDLRKMLRRDEAAPDPAAQRLQQTAVAQPALFTIEYALAQLLHSRGIRPAAMSGYSIGEYVAAHLAGVFSLDDALFLVATRARLIQALPPGNMLAVPLSEAALRPYLNNVPSASHETGLALSAINGEALCVAAGQPAAVAELAARLSEQAIATQPLPTTHAFHTEMMRPIAADFLEAARSVTFNPPTIPYISNLTGEWITAEQAVSPTYWLEHTCRPVRFAAGVETLRQAGYDLFLEVGPGQALTSLVTMLGREGAAQPPPGAAQSPQSQSITAVPTMRYVYDLQSDTAVLQKAVDALRPLGSDEQDSQQNSPAPLNGEVEQTIYDIWCRLLKVSDFDRRSSFFEIGGNSLLATQLIFRLRKAFRVDVPLRTLFEAPTIGQLAQVVRPEGAVVESERLKVKSQDTAVNECRLPNGLVVVCQSRAETAHFYKDIFEHRSYVKHGIQLPPGSCVFDVGGNIGLFTLFVHLNCPDARIITFEPAPPLFALLQENVVRHGAAAQLYPCALSRQSGSAQLTFYPQSSGMSSLYPDLAEERAVLERVIHNQIERGEAALKPLLAHAEDYFAERFRQEIFTCPVRTLSDVMAETAVAQIQLLKIDVQKSEYDVLLGIQEDDWPKIEQIVMEVHDIREQLSTIKELLAGKGYRVIVEQDALYRDSAIYNLYATREG